MKQLPQPDPRGVLALTGLPAALQAAEDATAIADLDHFDARCGGHPLPSRTWGRFHSDQDRRRLLAFTRPATTTERHLLDALGYDVPDELDTYVHHRTRGTRYRWWPTLTKKETRP